MRSWHWDGSEQASPNRPLQIYDLSSNGRPLPIYVFKFRRRRSQSVTMGVLCPRQCEEVFMGQRPTNQRLAG